MKYRYIDALRGIAILMVVFHHCFIEGLAQEQASMPKVLFVLANLSNKGVQLFYVASALTIFLSMSRRIATEVHSTRNFFIRRFFRIAPIYYLGIVYYLLYNGLSPCYDTDWQPLSWWYFVANATFTHGFFPYAINSVVKGGWSIGVEMMFYATAPWLFAVVKNGRSAMWFLAFGVVFALACNVFFAYVPLVENRLVWTNFLAYYFPNQLPLFAMGMVLYFMIEEPNQRSILSVYGFGGFLMVLGVLCWVLLSGFLGVAKPVHLLFGFVFVGFAYYLSQCETHFLFNKILIHIGKVSFSLYICHFAVIYWLHELGLENFVGNESSWRSASNLSIRFAVVLPVSVGIATVLYYYFEIPAQKLGNRFITKMNFKPSTVI